MAKIKNDCIFYIKGKCRALKETYCDNEKCKFYKSKEEYEHVYNKTLKIYEVVRRDNNV